MPFYYKWNPFFPTDKEKEKESAYKQRRGPVDWYDFMERMTDQGKPVFKRKGGGASNPQTFWMQWTAFNKHSYQPYRFMYAVPYPEPVYFNTVDIMCGSTWLWWYYAKIREGIAMSPFAQAHGTLLMKQSYQRKDAREMLATVQTLKTVLLNLESDLEKIKEQKLAFDHQDEEQIKGLFVDNYGGPSRSWTALARSVPLVRTALTWFYHLNAEDKAGQLKQADEFVNKTELNPAVANYLKRKVEEYWNWRQSYFDFLTKTQDQIIGNLRQQRANLQLYMRWAVRNIQESENIIIPYDEMMGTFAEAEEEFPQLTPYVAVVTQHYYDARQWEFVHDYCFPYWPAVVIQETMQWNPDIPAGNKFVRGDAIIANGALHHEDREYLFTEMEHSKTDFIELMKSAGGFSDGELAQLGLGPTPEESLGEIKERIGALEGKAADKKFGLTERDHEELMELRKHAKELADKIAKEQIDKNVATPEAAKAVKKEIKNAFGDEVKNYPVRRVQFEIFSEQLIKSLEPWFEIFGSDILERINTRQTKAEWIAENAKFYFWNNMKRAMGWTIPD